ncbi:hypothetical protein [Dictyobacter aurantiacus]|nr:hypothetical protein [Dictyobacter aurantiacus]
MKKERLNIYLDPALRAAIRDLAGSDGHSSQVAEELLRLGLGLKKGETIEQQSLPVIRDLLQYEMRKSLSQLRNELREDMQLEILNEMKAVTRRSDDRLASLIVRAIREGGLSRRMIYALLARDDAQFALHVYDDARVKVGKDLAARAGQEQA